MHINDIIQRSHAGGATGCFRICGAANHAANPYAPITSLHQFGSHKRISAPNDDGVLISRHHIHLSLQQATPLDALPWQQGPRQPKSWVKFSISALQGF